MPRTTKNSIIELTNIYKSLGSKKILKDVSLTVEKGEIFGFLGPNGAGKTTTIRVILNVLKASKGQVQLFDLSNKKVKQIHSRIGYLSDDMKMDEDLSGMQYLNFIDGLFGGRNRNRILSLAKIFEVDLKVKIGKYSRGNKQKIGLIAAIMHRPELLILDEPTSGFDPIMQEKFLNLLGGFKDRGGTVFMSSHDLGEVEKVCDRVAFIKDGEIIAIKTLAGLRDQTTKRVEIIVAKGGVKKLKETFKSISGLNLFRSSGRSLGFTYNGDIKKLLKFLSVQDLSDVVIEEPDLEDVFIGFYKNKNEDVEK
ncbi:MAG TPA: ABC transporter ATP-binding protein [Candidatus Saccharimonadales bacterium]|nr:ABC transporter ATP-binding protein [Candidatus Saccharimonadales bacterium]